MSDKNDIDTLIGQRVRSARNAAGLTQIQLATLHRCSYNKIHNIEVGAVRVTVADVIELGRHLGTSPLFLLQDVIELTDVAGLFCALADERARVAVEASDAQQRLSRLNAQMATVWGAVNSHEGMTL